MVSKNTDLDNKIKSIQKTMRQCKKSVKNMAILRNLRMYILIIYNKTRWSGKHHVLKRFVEIRDALIEAQENPESTLDLNATALFLNGVKKHENILERINIATKVMRSQCHTLLRCREYLDMLIDGMDSNRNNSNHEYIYIAEDSNKLQNIVFESGVCKIQNDDANEMTTEEQNASEFLILNEHENADDNSAVLNSYEKHHNSFKRRKKFMIMVIVISFLG